MGRYTDQEISRLSENEKYQLIKTVFRPIADYEFPSQEEYGKNRSFQPSWLQRFEWLTYSKSMNGGFCVSCVLFAKGDRTALGQLVNSPMTNFTRAKKTLDEHQLQETHVVATESMTAFMRQTEKGELSVGQLMSSEARSNVQKNRNILKSIVNTLILCGKQNIALRGHGDAGRGSNQGNFHALLKFRLDAGDTTLESHSTTAGRNAQYTSPTIQKDLLVCIGSGLVIEL